MNRFEGKLVRVTIKDVGTFQGICSSIDEQLITIENCKKNDQPFQQDKKLTLLHEQIEEIRLVNEVNKYGSHRNKTVPKPAPVYGLLKTSRNTEGGACSSLTSPNQHRQPQSSPPNKTQYQEINNCQEKQSYMMKKQQQTESKENKFNKKFCTTGQNNDTDKDDVIRHHYFSDEGIPIPCITTEETNRLFQLARIGGLNDCRIGDAVARNVSELIFKLLGGSNRLDPRNNQQRPTVLVLCGPHRLGTYGICTARYLSNHEVNVVLCTKPESELPEDQFRESRSAGNCNCTTIYKAMDIPDTKFDLIVNCLEYKYGGHVEDEWYRSLVSWCKKSPSNILAIDPSTMGCSLMPKWSILFGLPRELPATAGQLYLCDVGLPKFMYQFTDSDFVVPFGARFCIPLRRND